MDMYIHFNPYLIDINVLRIMGTVVIMKLNKRVSNITNGLRFCRPLPRKFLFKKCHIYIDTMEWKCISALASTE